MTLVARGRRRLRASLVTWAVVFAALGSGPLRGQEPASAGLRGRVVDAVSGAPVGGVLLRLDSGDETTSGPDGRFEMEGLPAGAHALALLSEDCRVTWAEVELTAGTVREARFTLAPAADVEASRRAREERRRAQGKRVTADEMAAMNARSLTEVVRRVAPAMVGTASMVGAAPPMRGRSRNSFRPDGNEPVLVVDGVRVHDVARTLDGISPADVESLEILAGSAAGWEYGSEGGAGLIRVTTRVGEGSEASSDPAECVVPSFPGG